MTQTHPVVDVHDAERTRTYTWSDQSPTHQMAQSKSGAELLAMMARGEIPYPPVADTVGFRTFEIDDAGTVVVTLEPQEFHYNPLGIVHGGIIAMLLDTVAGCAVHATLPAGVGYASLDLTTKFLRPVTIRTGLVRAEGRVTNAGARISLAEATLTDTKGRLLATAISTCMTLG
jgi:uncharacterized protein (TIGR00369 family)